MKKSQKSVAKPQKPAAKSPKAAAKPSKPALAFKSPKPGDALKAMNPSLPAGKIWKPMNSKGL